MSADLGALVASPHWRWMPGMLTTGSWGCARLPWSPGDPVVKVAPTIVTSVHNGEPWGSIRREDGCGGHGCLATWGHEIHPDLDHPPTRGGLLHLVREAWGDGRLSAYWSDMREMWVVWPVTEDMEAPRVVGATEADALAAALLAAPPKDGGGS